MLYLGSTRQILAWAVSRLGVESEGAEVVGLNPKRSTRNKKCSLYIPRGPRVPVKAGPGGIGVVVDQMNLFENDLKSLYYDFHHFHGIWPMNLAKP